MKIKRLFTAACMTAFAFITSGLQGKSIRHKKTVKAKQNTAKTVKTKKTVFKSTIVKNTENKAKHTVAKTSHTGKKTSHTRTSHTSGIYSISSNNKNQLIVNKMSELKKRHERIAKSGTASEKKAAAAEKKLLVSYSKWKGTKYAWGGDSKKGIDCSALTRRVYREVYAHELPRVSTQQAKTGKKISSKNLKAGDIVYFRPEGRTHHTAVYVGNSLFINASSSKGVVMSSLKSPYWGKYFKYGVRVDKNRNV